jgi:hypothetical protein
MRYTGIGISMAKEVRCMSQEQVDIADMQCWVFRMAQTKWGLSSAQCAHIFKKYDVFGFISKCYDILHLSSYQCALEDVEEMLRNRGEVLCKL